MSRRAPLFAVSIIGGLAVACGTHPSPRGRPDGGTVSRDGGTVDAGTVDAGIPDGGQTDGGLPPRLTLHVGAPLPKPAELVTPAQGISAAVTDAAHDFGGNLWAVSPSNLFLLRKGMGAVESWSASSSSLKDTPMLSVGGAADGVAWVGYQGQGDSDEDPSWMWYTGGVGQVVLNGADIDVTNISLISPPGTYPQYPNGRYKLRSCYRVYPVKTGPFAGDEWFGCNHGMGLVHGPNDEVLEHHHPAWCEWHPDTQSCTLHTGDVPAIAFTADGDVWFGGFYGVGLLQYNDKGQPNFWGPEVVHNLALWKNPIDPNEYGAEYVVALAVAQDGSLWAASAHSGLAHRFPDGSIEYYQQSDGLPTNELMDAAIDGANHLWIATTTDGVWRMDLATGELRKASGLPSDDAFRVVYETTAAGPMLTCTVGGGVAIYPGTGGP